MKYCVNYEDQLHSVLMQADEIKVEFKNRKLLPDIFDKYPDKTIILSLSPRANYELDWDELKEYNTLSRGKLILRARDTWEIMEAVDKEIPVYSGNPVTSFYQAKALVQMGVVYLIPDAPIFFELNKLKNMTECPLRAIPNIAYLDDLIRPDGINGTWIRPEDQDLYNEYITTLEFSADSPQQEAAIFDVYRNQKEWRVRLDLLIKNIGTSAVGRLILKESMKRRLNCGQRCCSSNDCHICYNTLNLANAQLLEQLKENKDL